MVLNRSRIVIVVEETSGPAATRNLMAVLERRGSMTTAQRLAAMSRVERQAAIRVAVQQATRTEQGRQESIQALRASGLSERQAASR